MRLFRRTDSTAAVDDVHQTPRDRPVPRSVEIGPPWMAAEDWRSRLSAYRRQGRSDAEILGVVSHLEKRGPHKPRTRAESIARAQSAGIVSKAEYMDSETEARALTLGANGLPAARLRRERDRLIVTTSLGWVNPKSRIAYRAGLHSFTVAGTSYHRAASRAGAFSPGSPVRLVREFNNAHDVNAVAVYAAEGNRLAGYVPKGQARRLAPLLDNGVDLDAITVRGSAAGSDGIAPHVLVCERRLYEHLAR